MHFYFNKKFIRHNNVKTIPGKSGWHIMNRVLFTYLTASNITTRKVSHLLFTKITPDSGSCEFSQRKKLEHCGTFFFLNSLPWIPCATQQNLD